MSQAPSMPLFCGDYLGDTMHLSLEEHGAYLKLLMVTWQTGKPLKDDDIILARTLGITVTRWRNKIKPVLLPFFEISNGKWRPTAHHFEQADGKRLPWGRWIKIRASVFERDGHACTYCGAVDELECDHVVPISRGGTNDPSNLTTACRPCNRAKSDLMPSEFGAFT